MTWTLYDPNRDKKRTFDNRAEAEEKKQELGGLGATGLKIYPPGEDVPGEDVEATDGGTETVEPEVVDHTEEPKPPEEDGYDLPEKPPVDEDPIVWMPDDFTDEIEGATVINRKGYEVMAHHYGISTDTECVVGPEETGFEFCRAKATATKPDGTTYTAHGSAHVDRGDDKTLLLEMADTRARKRALAQATGTGMLAVEEIQNNL